LPLHPDGYEDAGSGWPRVLNASPPRRRAGRMLANSPTKNFTPATPNGRGLYNRKHSHKEEEAAHRFQIAADHGERSDARRLHARKT
jgi:hypothetical protein